jgi:predicted Zn-ribbon and HTH transcriptional regulator
MSTEREAHATLPRALRAALTGSPPRGLDELSRELGVSEKELPAALDKLRRTLAHSTEQLCVEPSRCIECHFELETRTRAKRPSRCPRCSSERLTRPRFWIE